MSVCRWVEYRVDSRFVVDKRFPHVNIKTWDVGRRIYGIGGVRDTSLVKRNARFRRDLDVKGDGGRRRKRNLDGRKVGYYRQCNSMNVLKAPTEVNSNCIFITIIHS